MKNIIVFSILFLLTAMICMIALAILGEKVPGHEYFNPIGQILVLAPLIAVLIFSAIKKEKPVFPFTKFDPKPLLYITLLLFIFFVCERLLQCALGFARFEINNNFATFFNYDFSLVTSVIVFAVFTTLLTGFGEELAWRGYLFQKFENLSWLQLVLVINIIWALWHLPLFLIGPMGQGNILLKYSLFIIISIEFGVLLLYLRVVNNSIIPCMILHGMVNAFGSYLLGKFFITQDNIWAGWPNPIIVLLLLPITFIVYFKGNKLYRPLKR